LSLIEQNPQLTISQLCYLLYEMIGKTQLGSEIISSGYVVASQQVLEQLKAKYQEGEPQDERLRMIVKNVRRRLYDSLNVMISAKVLRKVAKNRLEVVDRTRAAAEGGGEGAEDELVRRLKEQLELRKAEIRSKASVREFLT
jgi:molecular chaperone GrpE (heat shock protein)